MHSDALDHGRVEALWMMLYITYLIRSRKGYDSCIRILTQRPALRQLRLTHTVRPMHYFVHHHHHFICMHWAEELDDVKMFQQVLIFVIDTKYSYCLTASRFAHKCHAMRLRTGGLYLAWRKTLTFPLLTSPAQTIRHPTAAGQDQSRSRARIQGIGSSVCVVSSCVGPVAFSIA